MPFRDERSGGGGKAVDVKSVLRMQHLQKLTLWAGGEASMPSYAAFLGNRLGICGEAAGIPLDSPSYACQRCESILQPGSNCTVRVETNGAKVRKRRNKLCVPPKNIVVYTCQFCSHRNVKKGTPKRHMKEILASKPKMNSEVESTTTGKKLPHPGSTTKEGKGCGENIAKKELSIIVSNSNNSPMHRELSKEVVSVENSPLTPKLLLLDNKRKRRQSKGSVSKEQVGNEKGTATPIVENKTGESSRKKRKGWSSLKEIAENSANINNGNIANLTLPFIV